MKVRLFVVLILMLSNFNLGADKYYFVIRVDDILSRNTTILPRSITPFEEAVSAKGAKVTWLVMPHRLIEPTNDDGNVTKQLLLTYQNGHEIGMHGFDHICDQCGQSSHEMYCTTYNNPFTKIEQTAIISESLEVLYDSVGVTPRLFVPPGHHADTTTYTVLLESGFEYISTTFDSKKNIHKNLYNLGMHNEYAWSLSQVDYKQKLDHALENIKAKMETEEYYCMLFHDPFIRAGYENGILLDWTSELLDSLNEFYGDKIEYVTLSEAADIFKNGNPTFVNNEQSLPEMFLLHQNYPNPFNPNTTIEFNIKHSSFTTLKVYDILGNEIAKLVSEHRSPGSYSVSFDANSSQFIDGHQLPSGIYFYSLSVGDLTQTKKMLLLK
jgi:predicted deacetylase